MQLIPFSASFEIITESQSIASTCQGVTFVNQGSSTATILGVSLFQGQSFSIPCNIGEVDRTNYNVKFDVNDTDQRLLVIRKNYN